MQLLSINKNNKDVEALIIVPENLGVNTINLITNYLQPLGNQNMSKVIFCSVFVPTKGVLKKDIFEEEWEQIKEIIELYNIKYVGVVNPDYFNKIMKAKKKIPFERVIGDVYDVDGIKVFPMLNYYAVSISPNKKHLLQKSVDTLKMLLEGKHQDKREDFLKTLKIDLITDFDIAHQKLKEYFKLDKIAIDIETTGLLWYQDELLTISFAKSETEGFSIPLNTIYNFQANKFKKLIKSFFKKYQGKVILHNAPFDIPFLVYNLWMNDLTDTENMINGVNCFDIDDTIVMSYLCLNNVDRPKLSLKDLAYVKYGNWDKDIDQSKLIEFPFNEVGKYNTIDTMATMYLYNEYSKRLKDEEQDKLYKEIYYPFIPSVIKMQMNGLTIDINKLNEIDTQLDKIYEKNKNILEQFDEVNEMIKLIKEEAKKKGKSDKEINKIKFNPKSTIQLQKLLFQVLNLPIINTTTTGNPSADKNTLELLLKMLNENSNEYKIVKALYEIAQVKNVRSSFTNKMPKIAIKDEKGNYKIYSNYNIAKVVSGRLSSSGTINLQNIPANSTYGGLIKQSIIAEKDYIIGYVDYSSLESRVMANFINSKNMKKIYKQGFDGHLFNLVRLRPNLLQEKGINIDIDNPKELNSLKNTLKKERNAIKPAVFMLNYFSSPKGLSETLKIPLKEAEKLYNEYHKTYPELNKYLNNVEQKLLEKGYCVAVMGLKIRCNLNSIIDKKTYNKALRTVGNALIQNSGLLMVRSIAKFQQWIEKNNLQNDVRQFMTTHDSLGLYITPKADIIYKVNKKLIEILLESYPTMDIPNEAELEIGKNLNDLLTLPNNANLEEIQAKLDSITNNMGE